jgi:YHS domain-containing protein
MVQGKDPVCGTNIDQGQAAAVIRYHGRLHYFCSKSCRVKFIRAPKRYLAAEKNSHWPCHEPDGHLP